MRLPERWALADLPQAPCRWNQPQYAAWASHAHPVSAEAAPTRVNLWLLTGSPGPVPGRAASGIGLHWSPFQQAPEPTHQLRFQTALEHDPQ